MIMVNFKQKIFILLTISIVIFLFIPYSAKALTYQEIVGGQGGEVLAEATLAGPTNLQNQCNGEGSQVSLSWNAVSGADKYLLRLNDTSNDNNATTQWGWYTPGTTDINADNVTQTTYTTTVVPGKNYTWWVHSYINSTYTASPAVLATFNCNPPPPSVPTGLTYECNLQGTQVILSWSPASGADYYLLRLNDSTNDSSAAQWGWLTAGSTDVNNDNVTQTSYTTPVIAGHNYIWWVHSQAGFISSNPVYGGFTCTNQQSAPALVNVRDYGAKGDGVTDDAPAIQVAIEKAGTGTTIYIPAGVYMLGTSAGSPSNFSNGKPMQTALWLKASGAIIKGDGSSTVLKLMSGKKMRILSITGDSNTIDGLAADGNKSQRNGTVGYPDGDVVDGLIVGESYRSHLTVKNCEVRNGIETGVGFWQNNYATVENCHNHNNGTLSAGGSGIDLSGGLGNKAINNRLIANTYGVWSSFGSNGTEIRNNIIQNNDRSGLALGGADPAAFDKNFIIDGNTISGNGNDGFAAVGINYIQDGTFTNNKVIDSWFDGIQIYDTVDGNNSANWKIENNICSNTGTNTSQMFGIRVIGGAKNITLKNNLCQNNGKSLADQIVIDPKAQVNSDWQTVNTITYGSTTSIIVTPTLPLSSTTTAPTYTTTVPDLSSNTETNNLIRLVNASGTYFLIKDSKKYGITNVGILYSYGFDWHDAKIAQAPDLALPEGDLLVPGNGALVRTLTDPTVYLISNRSKYGFISSQVFLGLGFKFNTVLVVTGPELNRVPLGGIISDAPSAHLSGVDIEVVGTIYWINNGSIHGYPNLSIYNSWHRDNNFSTVVPSNEADRLLPIGDPVQFRTIE